MANNPTVKALGIGTVLQVAMVLLGHFVPSLQAAGLFPVGGTAIGLLTGALAGRAMPAASAAGRATGGAFAGAGAGILGSLVSTALGDVPMNNAVIAGGSTLVAGGLGGILTRFFGQKTA
jgi:hypothetical protein